MGVLPLETSRQAWLALKNSIKDTSFSRCGSEPSSKSTNILHQNHSGSGYDPYDYVVCHSPWTGDSYLSSLGASPRERLTAYSKQRKNRA